MAKYFEALRTSRQLFPRTGDWLAFLRARAYRKLGLPMPTSLSLREFHVAGLRRPVLLRPHTSDFQVAREMFVRREYQRLMHPPPEDVGFVLDLGANIGLSVRLWQEMFPAARVMALEPEPENAGLCRRNVELGGAAQRVHVIEAAAAGVSGTGLLETSRSVCSHRLAGAARGGALQVRTMSIQDILREAQHDGAIDLLKCDIEGAEEVLFADCAAWIGRVRALIVEVHGAYTLQQLQADLARAGSALRLVKGEQRGPEHALAYLRR